MPPTDPHIARTRRKAFPEKLCVPRARWLELQPPVPDDGHGRLAIRALRAVDEQRAKDRASRPRPRL